MQIVTMSGCQYETARFGRLESDGPTIVMLHGGLGSVSHWKDFPHKLVESTGCSVFAYSRLGHGHSDPVKSSATAEFLQHEATSTLPAILRLARVVDPILLGHSDGASIALIHAATFPHAQRAVIAIAPHVCVEDKATRAIEQMRDGWSDSALREKLSRHHRNADDTFWDWSRVWLSPSFASWDIRSQLNSILAPVLLIQGANDEFGTPLQVTAIQERAASSEVVWIADCGHEPFKAFPDQTLTAVGDFLARVTRRIR